MATYAIGDIQGCYAALQRLLVKINFDTNADTLWLTGDLVNRGPQSLEVLRFFKSLPARHHIILGNHDLHLIACAYGLRKVSASDTLDDILTAPDKDELIAWLRMRPLLVHDAQLNYVMTHAGLAPMWSLADAKRYAREVETVLRGPQPQILLTNMYGNTPDRWQESLQGTDRMRCIINYFTRMRFCTADGRLDFAYKGTLADKPASLLPWYDITPRANADENIIFGHWAALGGKADVKGVFPLDTGCVWGGTLTALRLQDQKRFDVSAN